ncbi:olfactory receptor 4B13-like [Aulostomus maculatus]
MWAKAHHGAVQCFGAFKYNCNDRILVGLNYTVQHRVVLFALTLLFYLIILILNVVLIVTIVLDRNLHEPMYIFLCNLCINSLYVTAGFYPKFLVDLLSPLHVISYVGCLLQSFVIHSSSGSDLSTLAVMAYDRCVAIGRPLKYHSIMTKQRTSLLMAFSWLLPLCCMFTNTMTIFQSELCGSSIPKLFYMGMDNVSAVRVFTLSGINENYRVAVFSLTLMYYCLILFVNIALVMIIVLTEHLHEPMYILLCSVCINGLYGTMGFYPKFLLDLLSSSQEISYSGCLFQAFIVYSFACGELSILAVMAYDRYLAICRPLHYRSIMTKKRLSQLVGFSWLTPLCIFAVNILLTSRLVFCSYNIGKLLCVNWAIVKLACPQSDTFSNQVFANITIWVYVSHGFFIIWTYMHLVKKCVKSVEDRVKFMQTCVPHLISLLTFLFVIVFDLMHMRFSATVLPQSLQNLIAIEFVLIPPFMNPLIYGFKLTKIRNRIFSLIYVKTQ